MVRGRFVTVPPLAPGQRRTLRFDGRVTGAPRVAQPGHTGLEVLEARHSHETGETLLRLSVCRRQTLLLHGVDPRREYKVEVDGGETVRLRPEAGHSVQAILSTTAGTAADAGAGDAASSFLRIAVEGEQNRHVERVVRVRPVGGCRQGAIMGSIVFYVACSLDGYIARPNGSVDWLDPFNQPGGEDYGYADLLRRCGALIMGANSYRQVAHLRPLALRRDTLLRDLPTARRRRPTRRCVRQHHGSLAPGPPLLKAHGAQGHLAGGRRPGGGAVHRQGTGGRVHHLHHPAGPGPRHAALAGDRPERRLKLEGTRAYPGGIVQLHYRRA